MAPNIAQQESRRGTRNVEPPRSPYATISAGLSPKFVEWEFQCVLFSRWPACSRAVLWGDFDTGIAHPGYQTKALGLNGCQINLNQAGLEVPYGYLLNITSQIQYVFSISPVFRRSAPSATAMTGTRNLLRRCAAMFTSNMASSSRGVSFQGRNHRLRDSAIFCRHQTA